MMAMLTLRPVAVAINLVDRPGGRKTHHGKVPIVGGLAMFLGVVFGVGLIDPIRPISGSLLSAFALVVTVGMVDDRFSVSPWLRLPLQAAAAMLISLGTGTEVLSLGNPFGTGLIHFHGLLGHGLTILFVMTAINAFNMLDGMDGLAGTIAFVSLLALGWAALHSGQADIAAACLVISAATAAFLLFNLPSAGIAACVASWETLVARCSECRWRGSRFASASIPPVLRPLAARSDYRQSRHFGLSDCRSSSSSGPSSGARFAASRHCARTPSIFTICCSGRASVYGVLS